MTRIATGDAEALGVLHDRYGGMAYALAQAIVRDPADAEDVVERTFAQLWRGAAGYDASRGAVAAWLTMMTRTRALDVLRSRKRRLRLHERAAADDEGGLAVPIGGTGEAADARLERTEVAAAVRASLAELPAPQREAIELAFFQGLSHGEVAAALSQPLGTVKTRIRDGLQKLRGALAPHLMEQAS